MNKWLGTQVANNALVGSNAIKCLIELIIQLVYLNLKKKTTLHVSAFANGFAIPPSTSTELIKASTK